MSDASAVFLDTSIQIARLVHAPEIRKQIEERLRAFTITISSLVVRQEFKRRLLKDARYLLDLFIRYKSFARVHRHVSDVLSPYQRRKQRISLQLLSTLLEGESDDDLTERGILLLRGLIRDGLYEFDQSVGHVVEKSDCGCARQNIRRVGKKFDFGTDRCDKVATCGIAAFLDENRAHLESVLGYLSSLPPNELSDELSVTVEFIRTILASIDGTRELNPCQTVGDLLIAIESVCAPTLYTMNGKESQHLCRPLKQTLVVRPANPANADIECDVGASTWPSF